MESTRHALILCVDDEPLGLSIRKLVFEHQGYRVITAENASEGLAIFSAETVDLVVLDYMMPVMTGDVAASRMRQLRPSVPILLLSAYIDLPAENRANIDKFLTKGEGPAALLSAVADLLRESAAKSPEV